MSVNVLCPHILSFENMKDKWPFWSFEKTLWSFERTIRIPISGISMNSWVLIHTHVSAHTCTYRYKNRYGVCVHMLVHIFPCSEGLGGNGITVTVSTLGWHQVLVFKCCSPVKGSQAWRNDWERKESMDLKHHVAAERDDTPKNDGGPAWGVPSD